MQPDPRRHSPAAERNRGPIFEVLRRLLPPAGVLLEISSGTGQHAAYAAQALPGWDWQPSEADPSLLTSIAAWCDGLPRVRAPLLLDVMAPDWAGAPVGVDALLCANMLHIAPWPTCAALMNGAARHLAPGGSLLLYGPFVVEGQPTVPSNLAFDADLRNRNPDWGLRPLNGVVAMAQAAGLVLGETIEMPANNLIVQFTRPHSNAVRT